MSQDFDNLYSGAATIGKSFAVIWVIISTLFGLMLIIGGIMYVRKKQLLTSSVQGVVTNNPNCVKYSNTQDTKYKCDVDIRYNVDNKIYNIKKTSDSSIEYRNGNTITVYYEPANPTHSELNSDNTHLSGWVLIIIGILFLLGGWFRVWVDWKYKAAAAIDGAVGVTQLFNPRVW